VLLANSSKQPNVHELKNANRSKPIKCGVIVVLGGLHILINYSIICLTYWDILCGTHARQLGKTVDNLQPLLGSGVITNWNLPSNGGVSKQ